MILKPLKFLKLTGKIEQQFQFVICRMEKSSESISAKNIHLICSISLEMLYLQHNQMKMSIGSGLLSLPVDFSTSG